MIRKLLGAALVAVLLAVGFAGQGAEASGGDVFYRCDVGTGTVRVTHSGNVVVADKLYHVGFEMASLSNTGAATSAAYCNTVAAFNVDPNTNTRFMGANVSANVTCGSYTGLKMESRHLASGVHAYDVSTDGGAFLFRIVKGTWIVGGAGDLSNSITFNRNQCSLG